MDHYGFEVAQSAYRENRSVIGPPERTSGGNVVLRVGFAYRDGRGWTQTEHVVLTQTEARELAEAILDQCDQTPYGGTGDDYTDDLLVALNVALYAYAEVPS